MSSEASPRDRFEIRPFTTIEEYRDCVALQEETWGSGFSERVSPAILKVSQILGGVAAGAYDGEGRLMGFVFGMTGLRDGELVHWSDMLAVRPEAQNTGLGTLLKAYQRERVLSLGVQRMHWTFDPLQAKNAYLNFRKLGIVVREYVEDMYGQTDSPLHRGVGTDRCVALWLLASQRVSDRLTGVDESVVDLESAVRVLAASEGPAHPEPGEPDLDETADVLLVAVPADVLSIMDEDMELAVRWRRATRAAFTHYLARGYEARDVIRGRQSSDYVLVRIDEPSEKTD